MDCTVSMYSPTVRTCWELAGHWLDLGGLTGVGLTSRVYAGLPEGSKVIWTSSKNIREGTGLSGVIGVVSELSDSTGMGSALPEVLERLTALSKTLGMVNALTGLTEMMTALSSSIGMISGVTDALEMKIGLSQTMVVGAGYSYSRNWDVGQGEAEHTSSNIMGMIPVLDIVMGRRNPCDTRTHTRVPMRVQRTS